MRYVDSIVVAPDERILHRGRVVHRSIFVYPSSILTLFLLPLVRWFTCEAVVTSRRIVIAAGSLTRRTFELPLSRFESIRVEQSIVARLLGSGRCSLWASAVAESSSPIWHVRWCSGERRNTPSTESNRRATARRSSQALVCGFERRRLVSFT
jgi:hypothetical protein